MTLVSSLNIAQQALSVNQAAITVISNNIANVDNANYSKLSVNLSDVVTYSNVPGPIAQANSLSGVQLAKITRSSDSFLQSYYWNENSTNSYYKEYSSVATNVEDVMNTLQDSGLSNAMSNFYAAVSALNNSPSDASARANFVACSQTVANTLNSSYNSLSTIRSSLVGDVSTFGSVDNSQISNQAATVNNLLKQLASVNDGIVKTNASGITSNSLLDERDSLISSLSTYMNVTVDVNNNGTANISLGSYDLVSGSQVVGSLQAVVGTAADPAQINIVDSNNTPIYSNVNDKITGGSMGAILDISGSDPSNFTVSSVIDDLNTFALSFASIMNDIQTGDPNGDGSVALCVDTSTGQLTKANSLLFVNSTSAVPSAVGITAGNLTVNSAVANDPNLIAAARVSAATYATIPAPYLNDTGNNTNATLMGASRSTTYNNPAKNENLNGQTLESYFATAVSSIGYSVKNIEDNQSTQADVLSQIKSQMKSDIGVNLDEELADMIKYQRAYQAAARVFSTCNDLMSTLMQLGS